ncbi:hypothetical protein KCU81_g5142, partial [Aureobasidium melanogenum]|uniref:Uncharacterized protein n=1 Tax=Aureobasidium melanogenum (strain CBS 110374) TaxID=1043003 RepID=A0A074WMW4_AURM1
MPMTWDAAADAKLFTAVMAVYDIKISGAQNERIAKLMGDDVTPKAITHRLSKIKSQALATGPSTPGTVSRKRNAPGSKSTSTKTPASTKGKGSNGKTLSATHTITTIMHDNGSDDEEDFDTPTKTTDLKKRKLGAKGPKIEDADASGFFPGMGGDDDDNGDAIDFSVGYPGKTNIKVENSGNGGIVDLTEDVAVKVKKEVIEVVDMGSAESNDDDEMAI